MKSFVGVLNQQLTWSTGLSLVLGAFIMRALMFGLYIQHNERYRQADTFDYHACAISLAHKLGMVSIANGLPVFWRTPGYPLYLSWFYPALMGTTLNLYSTAHQWALWIQILLCSLLPLLLWWLAWIITRQRAVAWLVSWVAVFHLGFILSSCFLLSDALALLPLLGSMILFFKIFLSEQTKNTNMTWLMLAASSCLLALYTWIRPNGQFTFFLFAFLLLFGAWPWRTKIGQIILFAAIFAALIAPWYIRNYQLTKHWFYCPMSGPYLQTFSAPKIMRRLSGQPLEQCIDSLNRQAYQLWRQEQEQALRETPQRFVPREFSCMQAAWPIISAHPFWFLCDGAREITKTTFDLYAHQLVSCTNGNHVADPVEEFLSIKLKDCLFALPIPQWVRAMCWLEALFMIFLWLGILGGFIFFVLPLFLGSADQHHKRASWLWLISALLFCGVVGMTGGFGYARLRLPGEPLLIITSLSFWWWFWIHLQHRRRASATARQTTVQKPSIA
jgi:4-amino-4-deoxy-L-arabinose transferase-like glycosyltransferase